MPGATFFLRPSTVVFIMLFLHDVLETNPSMTRLSAGFNSRTAGRIWIKFGMGVIRLETVLISYLIFSTIVSMSMANEQTLVIILPPLA
jgi:hypothetical protein